MFPISSGHTELCKILMEPFAIIITETVSPSTSSTPKLLTCLFKHYTFNFFLLGVINTVGSTGVSLVGSSTSDGLPSISVGSIDSQVVVYCRLIETDSKSLRSVNGSRRNSGSSLVSSSSASSNLSHLEEDSWILWGRIVNEWEDVRKKKEKQVKVCIEQTLS